MGSNVTAALAKLGGSRGLQEVRSRGCRGPVEIELKIRTDLPNHKASKLITTSCTLTRTPLRLCG